MNTTTMKEEYLKLMIIPKNGEGNIGLLSSFTSVDKTFADAVSSRKIYEGYLDANESIDFDLRLWMDGNVTAEQTDSMNKSYSGKVSVHVSYVNGIPALEKYGINDVVVTTGNGLYEVRHADAEITYTSDETAIHNLKKTEYRYAGANPNNYVIFNNELWRIIGLVNTPEGQRVKAIRNGTIGNYSWSSGSADWRVSNATKMLNNGDYYYRMGDFSTNGLSNEAKRLIDTVTWNFGCVDAAMERTVNTMEGYNFERSNNRSNNADRTAVYGKVGLMYYSDYGYATSGVSATSRESCLLAGAMSLANTDCRGNNWLYIPDNQWTMTSLTNAKVYHITGPGNLNAHSPTMAYALRPTIYFTTDVKVSQGSGEASNPYVLL